MKAEDGKHRKKKRHFGANFDDIKPISLHSKPMTPDQLRSFKGFENVTDEMAKYIIDTLEEFSIILYDHYLKETNKKKKLI